MIHHVYKMCTADNTIFNLPWNKRVARLAGQDVVALFASYFFRLPYLARKHDRRELHTKTIHRYRRVRFPFRSYDIEGGKCPEIEQLPSDRLAKIFPINYDLEKVPSIFFFLFGYYEN